MTDLTKPSPPKLALDGFPLNANFVDELTEETRDFGRFFAMSQHFGLDEVTQALYGHLDDVADVEARKAIAKRVFDTINTLDGSVWKVLKDSNKLDIVAKGIAQSGWTTAAIEQYTKQVKTLGPNSLFIQQVELLADVSHESTERYFREICSREVKNGGARGLWDAGATGTRGDCIAYIKGQNLPQNFPDFDFFDPSTGLAKSLKSLDPSLQSYVNNPNSVVNNYKRMIHSKSIFDDTTYAGKTILKNQIQHNVMDIYVLPGTKDAIQYQSIFQPIVEYGQKRGVSVNIIEY